MKDGILASFLVVFALSFLILSSLAYAEVLHTDIISRFFRITGRFVETNETTTTTVTTVPETTTTSVPETTTTKPPEETTTTTTLLYCPTTPTCDPEDPCFSGWDICRTTTTVVPTEECPGVPISMWCPGCDVEKYGNRCLCPMKTDETGCSYWNCDACAIIEEVPVPDICPPIEVGVPICEADMTYKKIYDEKGCVIGAECVPKIRDVTIDCPESQTCPDGSIMPCYIKDNNCICENCPIPVDRIPEGCRQEIDEETGIFHIVCEEKMCPDTSLVKRKAEECEMSGGNPLIKKDPNGCDYVDCLFGDEETNPNPLIGYEECPSPEQVEMKIARCKEAGLIPVIVFEGGCRVATCAEMEEERCGVITAEMRLRITEECESRGLKAIKDFDERGCPFFACAGEEFCKSDLPKEVFEECRERRGEMVIKRDDNGCIVYSNCIERGDERRVYAEPVEIMPEPTELLDIAFKLEQLKIELDRLARKADAIADYYASVDNPDEHRFRRAADMFNSIKDKIDEIKNKLRERLDYLTLEDMEYIRFDIRAVKESLKDVVYLMLSNSEEVKGMIEVDARPPEMPVEGENCGTDGECFDRAVRVCKPITFLPEGRAGPIVTISGLEDGVCVIRVEVPEGTPLPPEIPEGTEIYMDCYIKDYSFGIRNPEEDILPFCEGPLIELVEIYGNQQIQAQSQPVGTEQFGGPGGCTSDKECKEYCEMNPKECVGWCESTGECPPETIEYLKQLMVEKNVAFCGNNICEHEYETSESCPQDCISVLVMCSDEDERQMKACSGRGGHPQSDPSSGGCEKYTGCLMPETDGICGCTWAAGSAEHPTGCTVLCSDYSYSQAACEKHFVDGCKWIFGKIEPRELEARPCVGCLNNGICDIGECAECIDCM